MVRKMLGPQSVSATALSSTAGVSQSTLSRWARTAGSLAAMAHKKTTKTASPRRPDDWPLLEKLAVVVAASEIPIDGLGAFLREKGVTAEQLETWRESLRAPWLRSVVVACPVVNPGASRNSSESWRERRRPWRRWRHCSCLKKKRMQSGGPRTTHGREERR